MKVVKSLILPVMLTAACDASEPSTPIMRQATIQTEAFYRHRAPDEMMTRWARLIPGLAGIYRGADGKMHILLTDTTVADSARTVVVSNARMVDVHLTREDIVVEHGEFGWLQLREWYPMFQRLLSLKDVVFTDIDERRGKLRVGISDLGRRTEILARLRDFEIPESAVHIEMHAPIVDDSTLADRRRPMAGSARINFWLGGQLRFCTPAMNLVRNDVRYVVTNSHCGYRDTDDDIVLLNASTSAIAVEDYDPPLVSGSACPNYRECRYSDAALFVYYDSVTSDLGKVLYTGYQSQTTSNNFRLSITAVGMQCSVPAVSCDYDNSGGYYTNIVGDSTGWNDGYNSGACVDVNAVYPFTYLCQMQGTYAAQNGDSGSLVWTTVTPASYTNIRAWGIHWASDTGNPYYKYYSLIENVLWELGGGFTV